MDSLEHRFSKCGWPFKGLTRYHLTFPTMLTFALTVQKATVGKPSDAVIRIRGQWHQTVLVQSVYASWLRTQGYQFHFRMPFIKQLKLFTLLKLNLSANLNSLCEEMRSIHKALLMRTRHSAMVVSRKRTLCNWAVGWTSAFFMEFLLERTSDKLWLIWFAYVIRNFLQSEPHNISCRL